MRGWRSVPPKSRHSFSLGWLRSPTDHRPASLYDHPGTSFDSDFQFETVAKATDTQVLYGALHWGFQIRSRKIIHEFAYAVDTQSPTFDEALQRYRGYFAHEPVVLYFDTDQQIPIAGEEGNLADVVAYLKQYSDVMIEIEGYADEQGAGKHNRELSLNPAQNVKNLAMLAGVDKGRILFTVGEGQTHEFSTKGKDPGSLRANRRVVISFKRTASDVI